VKGVSFWSRSLARADTLNLTLESSLSSLVFFFSHGAVDNVDIRRSAGAVRLRPA